MKEWVAALILVALVVSALFFIERYKFNDCKKVGHTTLYCIFKLGK